jgi:hypothetical protein
LLLDNATARPVFLIKHHRKGSNGSEMHSTYLSHFSFATEGVRDRLCFALRHRKTE